tara:strand:+ start:2127 stop:2966 length:840 start_codon:yes stop_codon:yes gene_type:complete
MTKLKHNKKRNTAFLYEALIRELTKSIIQEDIDRKTKIVKIIRENFDRGMVLAKELELYKAITDVKNIESVLAEKIIYEAKREYSNLDKNTIFNAQTRLISTINKNLGKNVFTNFVPAYKDLASISQIFNNEASFKKRMLLETRIASQMSKTRGPKLEESKGMMPIDNLVYKTFVEKFNKSYGTSLLNEQKGLLNNYIMSFADNGLQLKMFLNEEIPRLKKMVDASLSMQELSDDTEMASSARRVLNLLENFKTEKLDKTKIEQILKIQNLVKEINSDG